MLANLIPIILGAAAAIFSGLKSAGVLTNIDNEALNIVDASQVDLANYAAGQAVVLGTFSEGGQPGTIVAVKNGGAAAGSLGL